jgi:hypothetical protein
LRDLAIVDDFAPEAAELRAVFDAKFKDPRKATAERFCWDYWHVPGQYTALRTPAWTYFPNRAYRKLHTRLVQWGRTTLGCHDISPPWLSCYVDGCRQELHGDLPHGPWAFVLSLTRWDERAFRGGETLLLRRAVLDFWQDFVSERSVEEGDLLEEVEPHWNRLVVFDPRIPHGVRRVEGTHDPRHGRLVLHGWFVQPRPFVTGPLLPSDIEGVAAEVGATLEGFMGGGLAPSGLLSIGFQVTEAGRARSIRVLSDTTRVPSAQEPVRLRLVESVLQNVRRFGFSKRARPSYVTLPLVFERS